MKTILTILLLTLSTINVYCQKNVKDEALHAQAKRDVFMAWGDWKPKAKKVLGINTNPQHEMVWGWTAPAFGGNKSRNKNYQKTDIRPLAPSGKETQFMASQILEQQISANALEYAKKIQNNYLEQWKLNEALISEADPFYLIYFKGKLSFVENFSDQKTISYIGNTDVYNFLDKNGFIQKFNRAIENLKDRMNIAKSSTIERGQRIIFYHDILKDFRAELKVFNDHIRTTARFISYKGKHNQDLKGGWKQSNIFSRWEDRDLQVAIEIIARSKYK